MFDNPLPVTLFMLSAIHSTGIAIHGATALMEAAGTSLSSTALDTFQLVSPPAVMVLGFRNFWETGIRRIANPTYVSLLWRSRTLAETDVATFAADFRRLNADEQLHLVRSMEEKAFGGRKDRYDEIWDHREPLITAAAKATSLLDYSEQLALAGRFVARLNTYSLSRKTITVKWLNGILWHLRSEDLWNLSGEVTPLLDHSHYVPRYAAMEALTVFTRFFEPDQRRNLAQIVAARLTDGKREVREIAVLTLHRMIPYLRKEDQIPWIAQIRGRLNDDEESVREKADGVLKGV